MFRVCGLCVCGVCVGVCVERMCVCGVCGVFGVCVLYIPYMVDVTKSIQFLLFSSIVY